MTPHKPPGEASPTQLIEDVTVDCYNDDEALTALRIAIDEQLAGAAVPAGLAGFETTLVEVDRVADRRGLVARIRHGARTHDVALFDVEVHAGVDPQLVMLLVAYRQWCRR